jgi:hypothetical protein
MLKGTSTISSISTMTSGTVTAYVNGNIVTIKADVPLTSTDSYSIELSYSGGSSSYSGYTSYNLIFGISITNLHWGTTYSVNVNDDTLALPVGTAQFTTPIYVPDAPVITKAVPSFDDIVVYWNAVPNATQYNIYLNGTLVGNTTATYISLKTIGQKLQQSTKYTIGVQAVAPDVL